MSTTHFIEPLDLLFLRGNKLFGAAGSFGESLVPPWPSVISGAVRSALMVYKGVDLARFAAGEVEDSELGTPVQPGPFTVTAFHLARRRSDGEVEPLFALPSDLLVNIEEDGDVRVSRLQPVALSPAVESSYELPLLSVLAAPKRAKPAYGYWLNEAGWRAYLTGECPTADHLVPSERLWKLDTRVGVALDPVRGRAADGRLFTVQGVAFRSQAGRDDSDASDVGFLVEVDGARLPQALTLRLGGDGRAALSASVPYDRPEPDYDAIVAARRCRFVLATPAIFEDGWIPTGVTQEGEGGFHFELHGVRGRLVTAAVPRTEVISGWDLAHERPKAARRVVPTGAVYWVDDLETTPDGLRTLVRNGLWSDSCEEPHRRCEGFNRVAVAAWGC